MGRLSRVSVFGAFVVVVAAVAMVTSTPGSAFVVPTVRIAAADEPVLIDPADVGAVRTREGLRVDEERLASVVAELDARFTRKPDPGGYTMTDSGVTFRYGTPGTRLDREAAAGVLVRALRGQQDLELPLEHLAVDVPEYAIVVRLGEFSLDLYKAAEVVKRYPIGVGLPRYSTPTGEYHIKSKAKDPTWWNPGSSWSRGMPRYVAPGPNNPLGTRAMRLDRDLLAIHGTPNSSTVGRRSSHGCMRMHRADVEELFDIVPEGTPVYIFA